MRPDGRLGKRGSSDAYVIQRLSELSWFSVRTGERNVFKNSITAPWSLEPSAKNCRSLLTEQGLELSAAHQEISDSLPAHVADIRQAFAEEWSSDT